MIKTILSLDLNVDEKLEIKKNELSPLHTDGTEKRISIVTGIHGDELEGQYVCYQLVKRIQSQLHLLKGIIDIYPALNPLGIDSISRGIPMYDMDMNRIFPGSQNGAVAEYVAAKILDDIAGSNLCIDVHSSNIFIRELPQVRMNKASADTLIPYGQHLNVDLLWVNPKEQVHHATLSHSLNALGVPTLVVEMGVGMKITTSYGDLLVDGIFNLLIDLGIWLGNAADHPLKKTPRIIDDKDIHAIYANQAGVFLPNTPHGSYVKASEHLGDIIDPLHGTVIEQFYAPSNGQIISLREYPVVFTGSLLYRLLGGESHE